MEDDARESDDASLRASSLDDCHRSSHTRARHTMGGQQSNAKTKRVALVCTSASAMGEHATGAWLEEIATPYYAMIDAGVDVDVIYIAGGSIPLDAASLSGDFFTPDCDKFTKDETAQKAMKNSTALAKVKASDYDGVYLAGGHGTCEDFYKNDALTAFIDAFVAAGKAVAADCHGPIALLTCKKPDGTPLVSGAKVTCFTDSEENAVGLAEKVPCLVETEMKKLGAKFEGTADWTPNAVTDGKLVTGQNPASSKACADAFLVIL